MITQDGMDRDRDRTVARLTAAVGSLLGHGSTADEVRALVDHAIADHEQQTADRAARLDDRTDTNVRRNLPNAFARFVPQT